MKEKYSISSSISQKVFEGESSFVMQCSSSLKKFYYVLVTDQTIGKTLSDGSKKFTLDEAIRIAGDFF